MVVATKTTTMLRSLIALSKDGEWGYGEPRQDSVAMAVIRGTDFDSVRRGDLSSLPVRCIPHAIADRKLLRSGDIVLETAGGSKDRPTGRSLFVKSSVIARSAFPLICASFARFIRIDPSKADPCFIYWHLQYLYESKHLLRYHTQHTGVARFQFTIFADNEPLFLPPLPTQRKIAAILSAYDDLIANNTRRIAILEQMAQALYREWFVHLRYPGHEHARMVDSPLGPIPEGWRIVPFAEIAEFVNGFAFAPEHWGASGLPIVKIAELKQGVTTKTPRYAGDDLLSKYYIRNGDLLFSWSADLDAYIWSGGPALLNQHLFNVLPMPRYSRTFLFYALKEAMGAFRLRSQGTTMRHIRRSALNEVCTAVPPQELAARFESLAEPMLVQVQALTSELSTLRMMRDLLLPKLVSGEVDVEGLEIEAVSAMNGRSM